MPHEFLICVMLMIIIAKSCKGSGEYLHLKSESLANQLYLIPISGRF